MDKRFLAACEREPLHRSGAILTHGTLLVVDTAGLITHVAANIEDWLGSPPEGWLGQGLPAILTQALTALGNKPGSRLAIESVMPAPAATRKGMLDMVASRSEQGSINLELLEHQLVEQLPPLSHLSVSLPDELSIAAAQDALVTRIQAITGFQRVMLYRFREDGDGEVIAEARQDDTYGAYLGLRFPASDIPQIARMLYLKNPWRLIPDATAEPITLLTHGSAGEPPDLTYSDLRSVSLIHRVYLANMGVRASLSFPVIVGNGLFALVACHHSSERQLALGLLQAAAQLARNHAVALSAYQARNRVRLIDGMVRRFDPARSILQRHGDLLGAWPELGAWLMQEFHSDGAVLCVDDEIVAAGTCFEPSSMDVFDEWFCLQQDEFVWSGDSLIRQVADYPFSEIAGVMALRVRIGARHNLRIYLCRLEYIHEVAWGGNPDKPVEFHDGELGIAPRRSFEKWLEKRIGYSRAWDTESRLLALKLRELMIKEIRF